jgi:hypothetical protein
VKTLLVNTATWTGPELPGLVLIVNAPRPLLGTWTWQGDCRHGIFYAAMAAQPPEGDEWERGHYADILRLWEADDAWQVEFIDDAEIERRALAKARDKYHYADVAAIEADGLTLADFIETLQLPYVGAVS